MRKIILISFLILNLNSSAQDIYCSHRTIKELVSVDSCVIYNDFKKVPCSIKKYLKLKRGNKISFNRTNSHRKLFFIYNDKMEWLLFYSHKMRVTHYHLIQIKLNNQGEICFYSNCIYFSIENDYNSFKQKNLLEKVLIKEAEEDDL
jgi:hypothetical protein